MTESSSSTVESLHTKIAVLEERLKNRDEALKLQAVEYERRLDILNHAHEAAQQKNADYLRTDTYYTFVKEYETWRRAVDEGLAIAKGGRTASIAIGSIVLSALSLILFFVTYLQNLP